MNKEQAPKLRYELPQPMTLQEAAAALASGDPAQRGKALLRASLSDVDPTWVQAASLQSLAHPEPEVRRLALLALAHVARRYRCLDAAAVLAAALPLHADSACVGAVEALLDAMDMSLPERLS